MTVPSGQLEAGEAERARKFACDWTSCWANLACPGLDGGDHNAVCDSLTRETLKGFAAAERRGAERERERARLKRCCIWEPCERGK